MEIRWLGHSAFEIITDEGLNILIDPQGQAGARAHQSHQ